MKKFLIFAACFFAAGFVFAQSEATGSASQEAAEEPVVQEAAPSEESASQAQETEANAEAAKEESKSLVEPDATMIGADSARQSLHEYSVDLFEREASWYATMSSDDGVVVSRLFEGGAADKGKLAEPCDENTEDSKVLGVKADFFRRGFDPIIVKAVRPLQVDGIAKTISVQVAGRNFDHKLFVLVQDAMGRTFELAMGSLAFSGWRKMTATVPASYNEKTGVVQSNRHYPDKNGLKILGFRIVCDPEDAYGAYYIYFDDLRVVTDMFEFETRDKTDMIDNW